MIKKILLITLILSISILNIKSQNINLPLNRDFDYEIQKAIYSPQNRFFTSTQPLLTDDVKKIINNDSIINLKKISSPYNKKWKSKVWDKIFNEDFFTLKKNNFSFCINPLMDFSFGHDFSDKKNTYTNTRGFQLKGYIGKRLSFYSSFYENQASFPDYLYKYIRENGVIPGQGQVHTFLDNKGFDFNSSTAYLNLKLDNHFDFQFGHGKNFLGDGYRSLLLSDNSFNNLFFKTTVDVWHIKYQVIFNQYLDKRSSIPDYGYARKYSTVHYLSWAITKKLNISFFDAIIWKNIDSTGLYRGFDVQYLNPVIFMRPVEFSIGSPDNALMGMNASAIIGKHNVLYGQIILDEFTFKEVVAGDGYWANKQGFQIGFKSFDIFKIKNLYFQTEYNYVPPYTYSEREEIMNYGHYNQPLAHPFGANFRESVSFIKYNYKRLYFSYEFLFSIYGDDPEGKNYGKDIYKPYNTRENDYDNFVGQGIRTRLLYQNIKASFLINPNYNLNFTIGAVFRNLKTDDNTSNTNYLYIGLRTSLRNLYYDF